MLSLLCKVVKSSTMTTRIDNTRLLTKVLLQIPKKSERHKGLKGTLRVFHPGHQHTRYSSDLPENLALIILLAIFSP